MKTEPGDAAAGTAAAMPAAAGNCFHCGLPVPDPALTVIVGGVARPVCCRGCQAVAATIVDLGLENFYRLRTAEAPRPEQLVPEEIRTLRAYDDPLVQQTFVRTDPQSIHHASLLLEGLGCAACCWLIERRMAALPGVIDMHINFANRRAELAWDPERVRLSRILHVIRELGYTACPYDPGTAAAAMERERNGYLRRLGMAGLFGMQVMMISVALYFGDWWGMEQRFVNFFHWMLLLLTVPILVYSAQPFFANAWRDIRSRNVGMDVPVALGLMLAALGSIHATLFRSGSVYFDSIAMFVFILLCGRYLEFRVRRNTALQVEKLHTVVPALATRLTAAGEEEVVAVAALRPGDIVQVRPGECIPADGVIVDGGTAVDESLLSGESRLLPRRSGERLLAGSTNMSSPVQVRVDRIAAETVLAQIARLADRAQATRPAFAKLVSHVAGGFIIAVITLAVLVAGYWSWAMPSMWIPTTIAVLIVSCPCALALAAPAAVTAATGTLLREGILVRDPDALEALTRSGLFVFDKTGTLTAGRLAVSAVTTHAGVDKATALQIAAALESGSEHPLARVLINAAPLPRLVAHDIRNYPGEGVTGRIDGRRLALGSPAFVRRTCGLSAETDENRAHPGATELSLADHNTQLATFWLEDTLRPDSDEVIDYLRERGKRIMILSGDNQSAVEAVASHLGIKDFYGQQLPGEKLRLVQDLQSRGDRICMIGDGINDAPVLAAADVSVAMGGGTDLVRSSADLILVGNRFAGLCFVVRVAAETMRVMRQNIAWAVGYNLLALPLAACGLVTPWLAALGMTVSSLLVTGNAARLSRLRMGA